MSIQTREIPCRSGKLGIITLDSPGTLNALSPALFGALQKQLDLWADNKACGQAQRYYPISPFTPGQMRYTEIPGYPAKPFRKDPQDTAAC